MEKSPEKQNQNLKNLRLSELVGWDVSGIFAQVTNPVHLKSGANPRWRILKKLSKTTEKGKEWYTLTWHKVQDGLETDCGFTGCTVSSDGCCIQITEAEYSKIVHTRTA